MAEIRQKIAVTTLIEGEATTTEYVADSYRIDGDQYVLSYQGNEVARIAIADVMQTGEDSGIETIFSRS